MGGVLIMSTLARALEIAREAHAGQVDKAGHPYIEHVLRVVDAVDGQDAKIVAALHDVLEDCEDWSSWRLIEEGFAYDLVIDVDRLTRRPGEFQDNYLFWIEWVGGVALAVKLADLRDNSDPARLALLPEETRERLARKYAAALAQLGA